MFFLEKCHQLTQEDDVLSGPEHGLPKHKTQIIHKTMEHAIISPTMRRQYCIYIYIILFYTKSILQKHEIIIVHP